LEFIETLVHLYDCSSAGVDEILRDRLEKGLALLFVVLTQSGTVSRFAAHLARLLMFCTQQYMPGFAALWAANAEFLVELLSVLYEEQHSLLGRIVDLIDDLAVFDAVVERGGDLSRILLPVAAFFRRGSNCQESLSWEFKQSPAVLKLCFEVFANPVEFWLHVQMRSERKLADTDEIVCADVLFFTFINEIYPSLDQACHQRVHKLFNKCVFRTPRLLDLTFHWRQQNPPPPSPKSPAPANERDYFEYAVAPDARCVTRSNVLDRGGSPEKGSIPCSLSASVHSSGYISIISWDGSSVLSSRTVSDEG
jgi:hypothetical protein